jgi:hypothetical protein
MKNKKSQAAIEFLVTYGWILILVAITIGILVNYGFLNPSRYLPETLDCGEQLKCEEFFLDTDAEGDNFVAITLRNNFPREINITKMHVRTENSEFYNCNIQEHSVAVGNQTIIGCVTNNELTINERTKNRVYLKISFKRNHPSANEYNITGIIFAEPVTGEYCNAELNGENIHCFDNVINCGETGIDCGSPCESC